MKKTVSLVILLVLAVSAAWALNEDPNAALRKKIGPPVDPALAEFERVKKINNDLAITHFNAVLKKNPKDTQAYLKRGKAYKDNRDYEHALPDFDKALSLDPKLTDAYIGRAVCHLMRNETDKAWEDVHQAEALGGQFWPAFMDALKEKSGRKT